MNTQIKKAFIAGLIAFIPMASMAGNILYDGGSASHLFWDEGARKFSYGNSTAITGANNRGFNVADSDAVLNFTRYHEQYGAGAFFKWVKPSDPGVVQQYWMFGIDQDVTGGGFSIMDRNQTDARRLSINGQGYVGIGTTNPTSLLSVNGTIRAKEIVVDSTGWADYVFKKSYHLPSLKEVELHIAEHNTLPGVPSAGDIEKNGVNLAETNRILLEKVEELTLYVIDINKKMAQLEEKINR